MSPSRAALVEFAPAKINLTLCVLGRRADGYHNLESLVAFARLGDRLELVPGGKLELQVRGPMAAAAGRRADNLVLRAARALAAEFAGLRLGRFTLVKNLPAAAGLGGGSSDAAAALRLLARANRIAPEDPRVFKVARALGADVPACLDPRPRLMRGIGDVLSRPLRIPKFALVLVNPAAKLSTKDVFARYDRILRRPALGARRSARPLPRGKKAFVAMLAAGRNDLEPAAIALAPIVAEALELLRNATGCRLARMSGAGATCVGLFGSPRAAAAAARKIAAARPRWWVRSTALQ